MSLPPVCCQEKLASSSIFYSEVLLLRKANNPPWILAPNTLRAIAGINADKECTRGNDAQYLIRAHIEGDMWNLAIKIPSPDMYLISDGPLAVHDENWFDSDIDTGLYDRSQEI